MQYYFNKSLENSVYDRIHWYDLSKMDDVPDAVWEKICNMYIHDMNFNRLFHDYLMDTIYSKYGHRKLFRCTIAYIRKCRCIPNSLKNKALSRVNFIVESYITKSKTSLLMGKNHLDHWIDLIIRDDISESVWRSIYQLYINDDDIIVLCNNYLMTIKQCSYKECFLEAMVYITNHIMAIPDTCWNDRYFVIFLMQRHGVVLAIAPKKYLGDREVVLAAVNDYGLALRLVDPVLKINREIVLTAVKNHGLALQYSGLKDDKEIVLAAVKQNGLALEHSNLKHDREIVLAAVKQNGLALQYGDSVYQYDREIVLTAIKQKGEALQYTIPFWRNDREIVRTAIQQNYHAFPYASDALKSDREMLLETIRNKPFHFRYSLYLLNFTPGYLKNDLNFLLEVLKINPYYAAALSGHAPLILAPLLYFTLIFILFPIVSNEIFLPFGCFILNMIIFILRKNYSVTLIYCIILNFIIIPLLTNNLFVPISWFGITFLLNPLLMKLEANFIGYPY